MKTCFSLKHQCGNRFFPFTKDSRRGVPALTLFPGRFPEKMGGVGTALLQYLYLYLTISVCSHFDWEIAGKKLCVPHSQQDWWKSSKPARCTYNMQPDLLGSFPAEVSPATSCRFGWGHRTKFRPSVGGRGGHSNMGVAKRRIYPFRGWGSVWQKTHARYSTHQIPTDTHSYIFPSNTFHLWTDHFFQTPIQQKLTWRTYIFLETDLLGAPDACYGCDSGPRAGSLIYWYFKDSVFTAIIFPFLGNFSSF